MIETIIKHRKSIYRQPLPTKKQRTTARAPIRKPCKCYSEQEIFNENLKQFDMCRVTIMCKNIVDKFDK